MTDYVELVFLGIIFIILLIIIQYLMNPYWNHLGMRSMEERDKKEKTEEDKKKEEEFYREIWKGRKKSKDEGSD